MEKDNVTEILAKLTGVKRTSTGWSSKCPAHEDNSNSLSITVGDGGRLLLHCFVGCSFEKILSSIGEGIPRPKNEAVYRYTDEKGEVLFEVVRRMPKGFSQRRPVGGGKWEWNLKGVRRVLYRLTDVLKADGMVYIPEGEKDCDTLRGIGLVATTNSGGAGKWRNEYSASLSGKDVCLLPDNDETGRAHARTVALSLLGQARSVRVLELPDLPDKGDVTDWLSTGGRPETLEELARGAPLFDAAQLQELDRDPVQAEPSRMPNNPDVERAVVGNILMRPELLAQCRHVTPDWFHTTPYRRVWCAARDLDEDGQDVDEVTVSNLLLKRGQLEQCGGRRGVSEMTHGVSDSGDIRSYLDILRGFWKARAGIRFAAKFAEQLRDGEEDPDKAYETAVGWLDSNRGSELRARRPMSIDELYEDQSLRYSLFLKGVTNAIPTGFKQIDEKLLGGGTVPGFYYVIAADPSMGKTTLALDIICNAAEQGKRGYVVSREMPRESLLDRMVAAKSGVERFKLSAGISQSQYDQAMEALSLLRLSPVILDDTSRTIHDIRTELRALEMRGERVDILMVDYIQLLEGDIGSGRTNEVSGVSRGLKALALEFEIPVIVVSQLNRDASKQNREPTIRDLRESGQIEQDADFIGFIWGDHTEEDVEFLQKELICKKQREGPHFRRPIDMNTMLVTFRTPEMLGLKPRGIAVRRMGTDEEEVVRQKAGAQAAGAKRKPKKDKATEDFEF